MAIQLAAALGARVFTTAGSPEKLAACADAGRRRGDQLPRGGLRRGGPRGHDGRGADVILDNMGADVPRPQRRRPGHRGPAGDHRHAGRHQGRARHRRAAAQARRRSIATTLRARPAEEKAAICAAVVEHVWPLVADGTVRPVVHTTLPLDGRRRRARADGGQRPHRQDRADRLTFSCRAPPRRVERMSEQRPASGPRTTSSSCGPDGQPVGTSRPPGGAGDRPRTTTSEDRARSPSSSSSPPR